jgi:hypothetical protein
MGASTRRSSVDWRDMQISAGTVWHYRESYSFKLARAHRVIPNLNGIIKKTPVKCALHYFRKNSQAQRQARVNESTAHPAIIAAA